MKNKHVDKIHESDYLGFGLHKPILRIRMTFVSQLTKGACLMWRKPKLVEIAVGLEINAYACAEIV
jgi:coenzyme PQQ precursor peptide PqqA